MKTWISAALLMVVCILSVAFTNAIAGPGSPPTISGEWQMDLRTIGAVAGVVLPAVIWLSQKYARIEEALLASKERMKAGDNRFGRIEETLSTMEKSLLRLPCTLGAKKGFQNERCPANTSGDDDAAAL